MKLGKLLLSVLLFSSLFAFSQNGNQKGYYIDDLGNREEVFFKYIDIKNEGFIEIKKQENEEYSKMNLSTIKEYGIGSDFKFVKTTVKQDVTASRISMNKEPQLETVTIFLNTILEGKASLYSYNDGNTTRYFFISENTPLTQLIYKKYQSAITEPIRENNYFRNQLFEKLFCSSIDVTMVDKIKYNKSDLLDLFKKYNECSNTSVNIFENNTSRKAKFILKAYAGIYNSNFSFTYFDDKSETESKIMPAIGVEFATQLPSGKIEFFAKVEYEHLNATSLLIQYPTSIAAYHYLKYNSGILNFSGGPRFNFLIKEKSNFYTDIAINFGIPLSDINYTLSYPDAPDSRDLSKKLESDTFINLSLGVGYNFNEKMGVAINFDPNAEMLNQLVRFFHAKRSRLGVVFRYTLL